MPGGAIVVAAETTGVALAVTGLTETAVTVAAVVPAIGVAVAVVLVGYGIYRRFTRAAPDHAAS